MHVLFQTCLKNIYESESNYVRLRMITTKSKLDGLQNWEIMPIKGPGKIDSLNLDYQVAVSIIDTVTLIGGKPTIGLEISLKRLRLQVFIENIVPCGFLVVVSWVRIKK